MNTVTPARPITYELCVNGKTVAVEYSEEAMRALILHMGYQHFTVYNSIGYEKDLFR